MMKLLVTLTLSLIATNGVVGAQEHIVFRPYSDVRECGLFRTDVSITALDNGMERLYTIASTILHDGAFQLHVQKIRDQFVFERTKHPEILPGDTLVSINGIHVDTFSQLYNLLDGSTGTALRVELSREDRRVVVQLENEPCKILGQDNLAGRFGDLLYSGNPVRLIILDPIIHDETNEVIVTDQDVALMRNAVRTALGNSLASHVRFPNFSLISDEAWQAVLKESELAQKGFLDERTTPRIGDQIGATHAIVTRVRIRGHPKGWYQSVVYELVELRRAIVVGTLTHGMFARFNRKSE